MEYYLNKTLKKLSFDEAILKVTELLQTKGFGIITEIDVKETLKKKIDVDFKKYKILGACNPYFAYKALRTEDKLGVLLPCNVVVQENEKGKIEVSAISPVVTMSAINNPELKSLAKDVERNLNEVLNALK